MFSAFEYIFRILRNPHNTTHNLCNYITRTMLQDMIIYYVIDALMY